MTPRVIIGVNFRRTRYEHRTATSYSALMPEHSRDAEMLQSALLNRRLPLAELIWRAVTPRGLR